MDIRVVTEGDAERITEIYAPYVRETAITWEYEVPTAEEFRRRIRSTLPVYPYLVAEEGGRVIGYAYAGRFNARAAGIWSVETSIYVDRNFHGKGAGRALYERLEEILKAQHVTNMEALIACPHDETPAPVTMDSIHFHQRMGFHPVGRFDRPGYKLGAWVDLVWMEKVIGEHEVPVEVFVPFGEIMRNQE